jgi:hypothetical protein
VNCDLLTSEQPSTRIDPLPSPLPIRPLSDHLNAAVGLPTEQLRAIRELATQVEDSALLPLIGSGASIDCGARTVTQLSKRLLRGYRAQVPRDRWPTNVDEREKNVDLGNFADAILQSAGQRAVVEALGLRNEDQWPSVDAVPDHFCGYRILARLARESLISEAITFNYDCCFERGLKDEGFQLGPHGPQGNKQWPDRATIVSDAETNALIERRGTFVLTKPHGCAARYRRQRLKGLFDGERPEQETERPEQDIVICRSQLLDWRDDLWARDVVTEKARRHVVLLLGFSGADPVINATVTRALEDVGIGGAGPDPRVVAIDHDPETVALRGLVAAGSVNRAPSSKVTALCTEGSSITAVLIVFLAELLGRKLRIAAAVKGYELPNRSEQLIAEMVLIAPTTLRWTFLLHPQTGGDSYAQWANFEQARNAYVPLASAPTCVVRALRGRRRLRQHLGLGRDEGVEEASRNGAFIADPEKGKAFLPTGLEIEDILNLRPENRAVAKGMLDAPRHLEPILVGETNGKFQGVALHSGEPVTI